MGLGRRRPLCCFCWLFVIMNAICLFWIDGWVRIVLTVACSAVLLLFLLLLLFTRKKPKTGRDALLRYGAFLAAALLLGAGTLTLREHLSDRRTQVYAAEEQVMQLTVITREYGSAYGTGYTVMIDRIGESDVRVKAHLDCDFISSLQPGNTASVTASVSDLRTEDGMERALADGCSLYLASASENDILAVGQMQPTKHPILFLRIMLSRVQSALSQSLRAAMGEKSGALCAALLLGDRTHLDGETELQFRRAGASHLLALSGMHLGIVMAVVSLMLLRLRLPYRVRLLLVSLAAVAYLLVTGCALSTLRAALMLIYLQISRSQGRQADGLTSLSLFFAVCIAVEPYMLLDVSLWLTSLAVAVPVAVLPALQGSDKSSDGKRSQGRSARLAGKLLTPILISLLCMIVLILPMWIFFGEMSLLSPLSTLLLTVPVTALLCLGVLWLLLAPLSFWGVAAFWSGLLADGMERLADLLREATAWMSGFDGVMLSLRYDAIKVALPVLAVVLLTLMLLRLKRRYMALILSVSMVLGGVAVGFEIASTRDTLQGELVARGNSELLLLYDGDDSLLCDMSDGSYSAYSLLLKDGLPAGHTELDALLLTHYHSRHVSTLERLCGSVRIKTLYLPMSFEMCDEEKSEDDQGIARKLQSMAEERGIEVVFYHIAQGFSVGEDLALTGVQYAMLERSAHPLLALSVRYAGDISTTYVGAAVFEQPTLAAFVGDSVAQSQAVILGGHGPKFQQSFAIEQWSDELSLFLCCETAGQYLTANGQTLAALGGAHNQATSPGRDGVVVCFTVSTSDRSR